MPDLLAYPSQANSMMTLEEAVVIARNTNNKYLVLSAILFVFIILGSWFCFPACSRPSADHGPDFAAIEQTLAQPGPVRDDLVNRGLFSMPVVEERTYKVITPGDVKIGEIEKLVAAGVYHANARGYLEFGPEYTPPQ